MRSKELLGALAAGLLVMTGAAGPVAAQDNSATLKLSLKSGTSMRYVLRGQVHQEQTSTYSDDSTQTTSVDQTFEQQIRYDIGNVIDDSSSEASVVLESLTLKKNDEPPVTRTNVAEARARISSNGALRDVKVVSGTAADLDRLSIGAFAFEYPLEPMTLDTSVDRPFPILLFVTWHSERISAHSDTRLTSLSPTGAMVTQDVDFHEADVPAAPGVVAAADITGTATHSIDPRDGWPRSGKAEGNLETMIDTSEAVANSSDSSAAVSTAGSVSVVQTYERR